MRKLIGISLIAALSLTSVIQILLYYRYGIIRLMSSRVAPKAMNMERRDPDSFFGLEMGACLDSVRRFSKHLHPAGHVRRFRAAFIAKDPAEKVGFMDGRRY
ncbi:hypothetical protein [Paenibacillus sp. A3]|uniref:hypothetical protein n=1 Tax=Paenibacillus sp. A3 TaxID=1337054 RepID=UPI0012F8F419|nr:hypothetical protein [Paenibacillus sp. A3]